MGRPTRLDLKPIPCAWCGMEFKPLTDKAKYCSLRCRSRQRNDKQSKRKGTKCKT